jgi:hypothetical protein
MKNGLYYTAVVALVLLTAASSGAMQGVMAKKGTPFQAGYNHGCNDAKVTFSARYINQTGKGPSFHTKEFMNGYNRGFSTCSSGKASAVASNVGSGNSTRSSNVTSSSLYKQGYQKGVSDAKLLTPTTELTTDNVDCESPRNMSGQDSIQYCRGYEDGFVAENNVLLHK